jgi:hypothetical protein
MMMPSESINRRTVFIGTLYSIRCFLSILNRIFSLLYTKRSGRGMVGLGGMEMKKIACLLIYTLLVLAAAGAQETLAVSVKEPEVDGMISPGEYSLVIELPRGVLYVNRTEELLSLALQSDLDGWVSVGLGSQRMNDAAIYIGFVDDGEQVFAKQLGRGHGHKDAAVAEPVAFRLKENERGTVMEISFPDSAFIPVGASSFTMIVACGRRDNLTSYHSMRRGLEIGL